MSHLIETMGIFILIPIVFVISGVSVAIHIVRGLVTGGPRAEDVPGKPYLYDQVYYLLLLVAYTAWAAGLLAFVGSTVGGNTGFLLGWGVCALGMSALYLLRFDMILAAAQYQATQGHFLIRMFHRRNAENLDRMPAWGRTIIVIVSIVAGIGALVATLPRYDLALRDVAEGARILVQTVTTP